MSWHPCNAQDGKALVDVIEKQLSRIACTMADVCSASTDGGGENVGKEGLHAFLQPLGTGCVRKRGLEHLSWRICDAGLAAAKILGEDHKSICNYLRDGIAWTRLQAIATTTVAQGGLGLMRMHSAEFRSAFSPAPPAVIEGRPETDMKFLRLE